MLGPTRPPNRSKIDLKTVQNVIIFFDRFWDGFLKRFGTIWAPSWPPNPSQNGPSEALSNISTVQFSYKLTSPQNGLVGCREAIWIEVLIVVIVLLALLILLLLVLLSIIRLLHALLVGAQSLHFLDVLEIWPGTQDCQCAGRRGSNNSNGNSNNNNSAGG